MTKSSEIATPSPGRGAADTGALVEVVGSGSRLDRVLWAIAAALRKHWLLGLLLAAGLLLRAVAQVGYEPALLFIDSKKYIFGTNFTSTDWGSFDPLAASRGWRSRLRNGAALTSASCCRWWATWAILP